MMPPGRRRSACRGAQPGREGDGVATQVFGEAAIGGGLGERQDHVPCAGRRLVVGDALGQRTRSCCTSPCRSRPRRGSRCSRRDDRDAAPSWGRTRRTARATAALGRCACTSSGHPHRGRHANRDPALDRQPHPEGLERVVEARLHGADVAVGDLRCLGQRIAVEVVEDDRRLLLGRQRIDPALENSSTSRTRRPGRAARRDRRRGSR